MNNLKSLKSSFGLLLLLLAIPFFTTSCSDDEESDAVVITVDDAAELIAFSLANRTYGAVNNLNYVTEEVLKLVDCNETQSNEQVITDTSRDGEISVNYEISETYSKSCEGPAVVSYSFNMEQSLTSVRFDQEHDIDGSWTIEGVESDSEEITYNGPYNRSGLWTYNLQDDHTDNVTYESTLINLKYESDSERIISGTSTFSLEGTSTVYEPYSYSGDVEFLGSDISIITFSTGEQYELNLETGEITQL